MCQVHAEHQQVRDTLIALGLKVMLSKPQGIVAKGVHDPCQGLGFLEDRHEMLIGVAPFIDRRGILPHVAQIHMASIQG